MRRDHHFPPKKYQENTHLESVYAGYFNLLVDLGVEGALKIWNRKAYCATGRLSNDRKNIDKKLLERQYTSFFLPVNEKTILLSKKCFFCNPLPHLVLHVLDEVGPLPLVRSYHSDLVSDDAALDEPETQLGRTNLGINRKSGDFSWAHNSPKGWDWFSQLLFLKASLPCSTLLFLKKIKKECGHPVTKTRFAAYLVTSFSTFDASTLLR